jgi:hypothetical protein
MFFAEWPDSTQSASSSQQVISDGGLGELTATSKDAFGDQYEIDSK